MQSTEVRVKKLVILFIRLDLCLGRRKRIMCSDWPPGWARGFILLARDFSLSFRSFLFCFNLNFFLLHTNAKKKDLTSRLVNNAFKFALEAQCFACTLWHRKLGSQIFCFKVTLPRVVKYNTSSRLPSPWAFATKAFRVTWSKPRLRHRSELTERD